MVPAAMSTSEQPSAFLSYARKDDRDARITEFVARLGWEIELALGGDFGIFRDRDDITWGQQWQQRIDDSLDAVTFLIPIITPRYFNSEACRGELEAFHQREQGLGRADLILPVYWSTTPQLTDTGDDLAQLIASRNHADWRDLRQADRSSPEARRMLARLAAQVVASLHRAPPPRAMPTAKPAPEIAAEARPNPPRRAAAAPPTLVVDPLSRGTHTAIAAAVADAEPGDRIVVRAGLYREDLMIDKPIELLGEGPVDDIVLENDEWSAIRFSASMGRVSGITIRQRKHSALLVEDGRVEVTDCVIFARGTSAVAVGGTAHVAVRHSRIVGQPEGGGIVAVDFSVATVEDCELTATGTALVGTDSAELGARRNRVTDSARNGVGVIDAASLTLEDNQILSSGRCGLHVRDTARVTVLRNRIAGSRHEAIELDDRPTGRIAENDLRGNGTGPWDRASYEGDGVVIRDNLEG